MSTQQKKGISQEMKDSKFHKLFLEQLKDIYWAEKHLVKALPKMMKAATSNKLAEAIADHLDETQEHVARLEEVFSLLDEKPEAVKCDAMAGLLKEGEDVVSDTEEDTMVRDAGIIIACQKVEHYEIASYGSLVEMAKKMGHDESAEKLAQTLAEEKNADALLNKIAKAEINVKAVRE